MRIVIGQRPKQTKISYSFGMVDKERNMTPGDRLRAERKKRFRSARQAALAWGIPEGTYHGWENNNRQFDKDDAAMLASRLGTTPEYLLYGKRRVNYPTQDASNPVTTLPVLLVSDLAQLILLRNGAYPLASKMLSFDPSLLPPGRLVIIEISDVSMMRATHPSFDLGMLAIFQVENAKEKYEHGDIVLALVSGRSTAVIRQYVETRRPDGRTAWVLRAFNPSPAFEDIELRLDLGDALVAKLCRSFYFPPRIAE